MAFFNSAVTVLQTLVIALAQVLASGVQSICLRATATITRRKVPGHEAAHGWRRCCLIGTTLVPLLSGLFG